MFRNNITLCTLLTEKLLNVSIFCDMLIFQINQCKTAKTCVTVPSFDVKAVKKNLLLSGMRHCVFIIKKENCERAFSCEYDSLPNFHICALNARYN